MEIGRYAATRPAGPPESNAMTTERNSRADLERAIQAAQFPVGVFWTNTEGECIGVNARWCELSGLTEEQSLGLGWTEAVHPEDRSRVAEEQAAHLARGENMAIEFRLCQPGGRTIWVLSHSVGSFDESGRVNGFMGTVTDITERVTTEYALRESEERFRGLVELSPDLVAIHRNGNMLYVNASGLAMMRASEPADLVGHHILEFVLPEHQAIATARMGQLREGIALPLAEMEIRRCDGEIIWIETVASLTRWQGDSVVQLVARDVTERRKTAEAYRVVVENIREPMWTMDRGTDGEWRSTFVNETYLRQSNIGAAERVLGKTQLELVADGLTTLAHAQRTMARYEEAANSIRPVEFEYTLEWNGIQSYIQTTMSPVRDETGKCYRLICWSRDLSRRRGREQALAESEANYRAVVEGTSDAVWVMDRDADDVYRVRLANSRTESVLGVPASQMVGKTLHEFLHARPAAAALARYNEAEEAREPIEYETVIERPGVPRLEVVTHLTPLFDGDGRCYRIIGSARDVTDRRRAEAALLQAQKIESLGVLAGGIAHDFNNLLTTILGNLFLLDRELEQSSALKAYTNDARVASERGADLVKRMLGFSRPGVHSREEVSLDMLFGETASLVQRTLGPSVALVIEPAPAPDGTAGEFSALQQVIVNLLLNARDAMPDGGRIVLRRGLCEIAADQIWHQRGVEPGRFHEITIADQGVGMSRDLVQRIFDPFFTTKGVGKGTGLGLSTAFSIVRAHGGWLEVESKEGAGSTFRILLPAL